MAAEDNTAKSAPARPSQPYRPQIADQGRGDMVSENRGANDRFERNSKALQLDQAKPGPERAETEQGGKKELSFGPDRQHRPNHNQLKQEQVNAVGKSEEQQQSGAKKELTFGPGRGQDQEQGKGHDEPGLGL